jgi:hypothetical protein
MNQKTRPAGLRSAAELSLAGPAPLQLTKPPRIDPTFFAPLRGQPEDGLLLASKKDDPLPVYVPIPDIEIGQGETLQLLLDGQPYGASQPIPVSPTGGGELLFEIDPLDRQGGNPNRGYLVSYRYNGGANVDEDWDPPIPFIVDLIAPGFPAPLAPPTIAASIVNNVLDDATLTALGNQVPATIYAYTGIDPGDDVYLRIGTRLTDQPVLTGAVGPVAYLRSFIGSVGDGIKDFRYVVEDRAGNRGVSDQVAINVQLEVIPEVTAVVDTRSAPVPNGSITVETRAIFSGTAAANQEIELFVAENNNSKGRYRADGSGAWTTGTPITFGLGQKSFVARVVSSGVTSVPWILHVVAEEPPEITQVKDSQGDVVNGGTTFDTDVTLSGTASAGLSVDISDTGVFKDTFVATGGIWTTTAIAVAQGPHSFTAKAKYGDEPESSPRTLNVALLAPTVKETVTPGGVILNPINAQNSLTVVVPQYDDMRGTDQLSVTWTGASGTPAGGSHTTSPVPVGAVGAKEVQIPVSVIAFNLDKQVSVTYTVTRDGSSWPPSRPLNLTVLPIANESADLPTPTIDGADDTNQVLDVTTLTATTYTRVAKWPFIALGQKLWLRYYGTRSDNTPYEKTVYNGTVVTTPGLSNGAYERVPVDEFKALKDATPLRIEFKATFDGATDENKAVTFPVRTYTVKAFAQVPPTIVSVKDAQNVEIPNDGSTTSTTVTLSGKASNNQQVQILDGTTVKETVTANASGDWNSSAIAVAVSATAHRFTAKGLYGSPQPVSEERTLTVVATVTPTIVSVQDAQNVDIPNGTSTISTTVKLSGKVSNNQQVQILDGTTDKGTVTANASGDWTLQVTGLTVAAHRFTAKGLYGSPQPVSEERTLTVVATVTPTIVSVKDAQNVEIPNDGSTTSTTVTLSGLASILQDVQILDNATVDKGTVRANANGVWSQQVTGLSVAAHSFTAKGLYGDQPVSEPPRTLSVGSRLIITGRRHSSTGNFMPCGGAYSKSSYPPQQAYFSLQGSGTPGWTVQRKVLPTVDWSDLGTIGPTGNLEIPDFGTGPTAPAVGYQNWPYRQKEDPDYVISCAFTENP